MSTIDSIDEYYKNGLKDLIFIKLKTTDFAFLKRSIEVPVLISTIKKDRDEKTISIDEIDILLGIGYIAYQLSNKNEEYCEIVNQIANKTLDNVLKEEILIKAKNAPVEILIATAGLIDIVYRIELLETKTILARHLLENQIIDETKFILEYREDLTTLYDKTNEPRFGYYIGKSYEASGEILKARLIYQKVLKDRKEKLDKKYKNEYNEVVEALDSIYNQSEIERIEYLISYEKYDEAEAIIAQLPDSKTKLKSKILLLMKKGEDEAVVAELDEYLAKHGNDYEVLEFKKSLKKY